MPTGVRGSNPIWAEFDLQGNIFDDTYYMFVLENTIPYAPSPVYHYPNLTGPWTNPIRFLGNGTLPTDIFFDSEKIYRLEFRRGNTQADPLIYEINDYVAGGGGSGPIDTVAFSSDNQITNPQFSLISFTSSYVVSGTDPAPIEIAPGWYLEVAGTGSATIERLALNNTNLNPTNAPYALRLLLSGWNTGSVYLRQRFQQNGMLWANKYVSSSVTARLVGAPQSISASLVDSNGALLGNVLNPVVVGPSFEEFTDYAELPPTTNPDVPPAAYIDYKLAIPSNIDIYLSSFQLIVQDVPAKPPYDQDSINRQIDHTYNTAYPIVPIGAVIDFAGSTIPLHYYLCDGAEKSRATNDLLFQALTITETVTLTSGVNTFTVVSSANYYIGMAIEGTNIPASTTISNIVGTTITMSNLAGGSGPSTVRFFAWGAGNGTTTFNVPDLTNYVTAGSGGNLFGAVNQATGYKGGSSTHTLLAAELPPHSHTYNATVSDVVTPNTGGGATLRSGVSQNSGNGPGASTPFTIVQPTALVKKCIRYQ